MDHETLTRRIQNKRDRPQQDMLKAAGKSLYQDRNRRNYAFICPLCTSPRKIKYSPQPTASHFLQIALTSVFFTLVCWNLFSWKGIVSFLPFWVIFEVIYRSRVRVALACEQCGFDPVLYLVDVDRARGEVDKHWRAKFAEKGIPYPKDIPEVHLEPAGAQEESDGPPPKRAPDPLPNRAPFGS